MITQTSFVKHLILGLNRSFSSALDGTLGRGNDALFLSNLVGIDGELIGFDIQDEAVKNTISLLERENCFQNYRLIKDCHSNLDMYLKSSVDIALYNLGYMPKGDKKVKTKPSTTVKSLSTLLKKHLSKNGLLFVTCYRGHPIGFEETQSVIEFVRNLDCKSYTSIIIDYVNLPNNPPIVCMVEKR